MRGFRFRSGRRRSCLRPSAEHVSAYGRRNEAPRCTREKTSGTQGRQCDIWVRCKKIADRNVQEQRTERHCKL